MWIDANLKSIQIEFEDKKLRKHILQLNIPPDYPISSPICNVLFPEVIEINWNHSSPSTSSVQYILDQYILATEKYQEIWRHLEDIDSHCWVIEPEFPSYESTMRRLALGNLCSLQIEMVIHY